MPRPRRTDSHCSILQKVGSKPPRAMIQSLSVKGAEAGARGPRLLGECSTDSTSFVRVHSQPLLNDPEINCSLSVPLRSSTALKRDQLADISLSSTNAAFTPKSGHC